MLAQQADLSAAFAIRDWNARGQYVYDRLVATANESQKGVRALLGGRGVKFKTFWSLNAVTLTADWPTLDGLAARDDVSAIYEDRVYSLPDAVPEGSIDPVNGVDWNIDRIGASRVWSQLGVRGEGLVVANIDTGVQFDHPALIASYRGNLGNGSFDHNYNWYDPTLVCGSPQAVPCDNHGHGSHTMGTMVGDDGVNHIGVAPGARWIAAKGCANAGCTASALVAAGQWILAPTNLQGLNPRPDLRPNIVSNSWGGGENNPGFRPTVQAWVASGIFPAMIVGNSGPDCFSDRAPGEFPESYAAGAFDSNNLIASTSGRGPSVYGILKPNIAAPGVSIRSSVPPNLYQRWSGTSMAAPHVAGTVALMWSANRARIGNIDATRAILDDTALDVLDLQCGGTLDANNVWGEGRLDAFRAVVRALGGCNEDADCNDGLSCTHDACNTTTNACEHVADDAACSDSLYCNGNERCDVTLGCVAGTPVSCEDGVACTVDTCNEGTQGCDHVPSDTACNDGLYCNGTETCNATLGCVAGVSIDCTDAVGCTADACNESLDACDHLANSGACSDGLYCNGAETCNPITGCLPAAPLSCDDGIGCTADSCNESAGRCDHVPNDAVCNDNLFCNGVETCSTSTGCRDNSDPCSGAQTCDESADACLTVPTVTFKEAKNGKATGKNTVATSAALTAATGDLYLAAIGYRRSSATIAVSKVTGLGLTWTQVASQCSGRGQNAISVWKAQGTPTGGGVVTATFTTTTDSAIGVTRYSGASTTSPLASIVAKNTTATGACAGGTDSSSYAITLPVTKINGVAWGAATMRSRTNTAGAGFTERYDLFGGNGNNAGSVAGEDTTVTATGSLSVKGTFSGPADWAAVAIELR